MAGRRGRKIRIMKKNKMIDICNNCDQLIYLPGMYGKCIKLRAENKYDIVYKYGSVCFYDMKNDRCLQCGSILSGDIGEEVCLNTNCDNFGIYINRGKI